MAMVTSSPILTLMGFLMVSEIRSESANGSGYENAHAVTGIWTETDLTQT